MQLINWHINNQDESYSILFLFVTKYFKGWRHDVHFYNFRN